MSEGTPDPTARRHLLEAVALLRESGVCPLCERPLCDQRPGMIGQLVPQGPDGDAIIYALCRDCSLRWFAKNGRPKLPGLEGRLAAHFRRNVPAAARAAHGIEP